MNQASLNSTPAPSSWQAKLKGAFMLFRVLAVLVWAFNAGLISNAAAVADGHPLRVIVFVFVLLIAALVQGYPAHIVNEIYDWQSGADRPRMAAGEKSQPSPVAAKLLRRGCSPSLICGGCFISPPLPLLH